LGQCWRSPVPRASAKTQLTARRDQRPEITGLWDKRRRAGMEIGAPAPRQLRARPGPD